jgi:DNA polymerase-3 subunit epsilon
MIIYFDTETTGLSPGGIIQLSYIMQDNKGVIGKNFFFFNSYISPQSTEVHGITVEKLYALSKGKTFYDYIDEIERDFESADLLIAHNFPFDFKFMVAEFERCYTSFRYKESFDTMRRFNGLTKIPKACGKGYKYPKLCEMAEFFEVYDYDASTFAIKTFGGTGISHDARFDIAQTFLCVEKAKSMYEGLEEELKKYL